ncbi:MAG: hypothetical protein N3E40_01530 [Dehalococcoidia bacterium]|nr:hypothetical protein [Dehalococcoidia bacterium]
MTKPLNSEQLQLLETLTGGNKWALKFCLDLLWVGHLWDDLIDMDVERTREDVNRAFMTAFHELWVNPFIQSLPLELRDHISGLVASTAMQYLVSTELELGDDDDRFMAFICSNAVLDVIQYVSVLCVTPVDETVGLFRAFNLRSEYLNFVEEGKPNEGLLKAGS